MKDELSREKESTFFSLFLLILFCGFIVYIVISIIDKNRKDRLVKCIKVDECVEYIRKNNDMPTDSLIDYLIGGKNG